MKKYLIIALCLVMGMEAWAQEGRNARVTIGMNNLTYTKPENKTTLDMIFHCIYFLFLFCHF